MFLLELNFINKKTKLIKKYDTELNYNKVIHI
jgi:hypothetical protein